MKKILTIACLASTLLLASCSFGNKTTKALNKFEDLVEEVEKQKGEKSLEEWSASIEEYKARFEEIFKDVDENDLNTVQSLRLVALTGRWGAAMFEAVDTEKVAEEIATAIEEEVPAVEEELQKAAEAIEEAAPGALEELKKVAEEVEKAAE